jgi:formate hydrogenlyase transcriptional activator
MESPRRLQEVAGQEEEKMSILSFSNEIANIKNRADLYDVVVTKIIKIFGIDRLFIAKINEDQTTISTLASAPADNTRHEPDRTTITRVSYRVDDPLFAMAIASEDPVLFDISLLDKELAAPGYVDFWKSIGMHYVLIVALRTGGRTIGFAILNFDGNENIDTKSTLLKGICAQLAVKLSSILANEEIEKNEQEKSRLLAFSNAIASERDRAALAKILKQQLKALFQIDDYTIDAYSDDKQYSTPMLFDPDANDAIDANDFGDASWVSVTLRLGQENIGVLNFRQNDRNQASAHNSPSPLPISSPTKRSTNSSTRSGNTKSSWKKKRSI